MQLFIQLNVSMFSKIFLPKKCVFLAGRGSTTVLVLMAKNDHTKSHLDNVKPERSRQGVGMVMNHQISLPLTI